MPNIRAMLDSLIPQPVLALMLPTMVDAIHDDALEMGVQFLGEPDHGPELTEGEAWYCIGHGLREQGKTQMHVRSAWNPPGMAGPMSLGTLVIGLGVLAGQLATWHECSRGPKVPGGVASGPEGGWSRPRGM